MWLCIRARKKTAHKRLVALFAVVLAPFAFSYPAWMVILWVLYVSYLLLRTLIEEPERRAVVSAVFGIFAAVDIPLVYFSIWFFRTQHPQPVIGGGGSIDPRMLHVLLINWLAFSCFALVVCWWRYRLEMLQRAVDEAESLESLMGVQP